MSNPNDWWGTGTPPSTCYKAIQSAQNGSARLPGRSNESIVSFQGGDTFDEMDQQREKLIKNLRYMDLCFAPIKTSLMMTEDPVTRKEVMGTGAKE